MRLWLKKPKSFNNKDFFVYRNSNTAERKRYVDLVKSVKDSGGTVHIFSSLHVSGEREYNFTIPRLLYCSNQTRVLYLAFSLNIILDRIGESNRHCSNPSVPAARPRRPGDVIGKPQLSLLKWYQDIVYCNFLLVYSVIKLYSKSCNRPSRMSFVG